MSRRSIVLALAAVLVVAVAVPVIAQERLASPQVQALSKRAVKKAKTALRTARAAKRQARGAASAANAAGAAASEAKGLAGGASAAAAAAQATLASTRAQAGFAAAQQSTGADKLVALSGGPSVTVDVPPSGLIEVWAQATIEGEGAVSLFEDGKIMAGQARFCGPDEESGVLFSAFGSPGEPVAVATPATFGPWGCGSLGAPGAVLFQTTPGPHTYELRYGYCGCEPGESVSFSARRLVVAPRL